MLPEITKIWAEIRSLRRELKALQVQRQLLDETVEELHNLADTTEEIGQHLKKVADKVDEASKEV